MYKLLVYCNIACESLDYKDISLLRMCVILSVAHYLFKIHDTFMTMSTVDTTCITRSKYPYPVGF